MKGLFKAVGIAALVLSFFGACLSAMLDPSRVFWIPYGFFLILGALGVALIRLESERAGANEEVLAGQLSDIDSSLDEVVAVLSSLVTRQAHEEPPPRGTIGVYALPEAIDESLRDPIASFVDAREAIARVHGTQAYADIMGEFAAGERYVNRVWSAAAEGYVDEASEYLSRSLDQFERARAGLEDLRTSKLVGSSSPDA